MLLYYLDLLLCVTELGIRHLVKSIWLIRCPVLHRVEETQRALLKEDDGRVWITRVP
jgi:hypothetical protein